MQVFKTYFKILQKQLVPILIYAGIFLFISIMITSNIRVENEKYKSSKVKTMVINKDGQSSLIDGFLEYLEKYADFVETEEDEDKIKDALFFRKAVYILTIPEGFTDQFLKSGEAKLTKQTVPDSIEAISIDNAIDNYFNMARVYRNQIQGIDYEQLNSYIEKNLEEETEVKFNVVTKDEVTYSNGYNMNFFNFLAYIMVSAFITGVSMVMFSFHGVDIRRRHSASPLTSRFMNIQLLFANLIFVMSYLLVFIIAAYILNRDRMININTLLTWLNAFVFSITALSISYLVGITVKSRKAIAAIATTLSLGLSFLSGIFVPQEYLGSAVLKVAGFTPTFWYVKANNAIGKITSFQWEETSDIFSYMAIQIGFAAAFISISLVVSKRKSQQAF
jgi:ABC-2 type transport system permease protein